MATHPMRTEVQEDLGRILFTCMVCDRSIAVGAHDGEFTVLRRGDQMALHSTGSGLTLTADVESGSAGHRGGVH